MICKICERNINVKGFKHHVKTKHGLNKDSAFVDSLYWNLLIEAEIQTNIINDYTFGYAFIDLAEKYGFTDKMIKNFLIYKKIKFRNNSECKKTDLYITKYNKTINEKYGVDNISQLDTVKLKKIETMMKNYGRTNQFQDESIRLLAKSRINFEEVLRKHRETIMTKYGVENVAQIPHVREKISKTRKEIAKDILTSDKINNFWKKIKFISSLEKKIHSALFDLGIDFQNNIWVDGYSIDIYLKSYNLIIEVNGDYWHANPLKYEKNDVIFHRKGKPILANDIWNKDERKRNVIIDSKYNFEVIWENEIKTKNENEIKELVQQLLKKYEN